MASMVQNPKVKVMLSGGVDSSVALSVLQDQNYEVEAVFMRCWSQNQIQSLGLDPATFACSFEDDQRDAELIAKKLGVPFEVWDFEANYKQLVVDYMLNGYRNGITPNPDIMCNSFIKFGVFFDKAKVLDPSCMVATGHYAKMIDIDGSKFLARARDTQKDQSYFLCRVNKDRLAQTLFPIGEFNSKAEVRAYASQKGLLTATKKDSQGLCFVGKVALDEMLMQVLGKKTGDIIDQATNKVLGQHNGAFLFTVGQRQGLGLSGGPWFVVSANVDNNQVFVAHIEQSQQLETNTLQATSANWLADKNLLQEITKNPTKYNLTAQIRYRQKAEPCRVVLSDNLDREVLPTNFQVLFHNPVRAVAVGQSVVLYANLAGVDIIVGSGVIS